MVVKTKFSKKEFEKILSNYDLGQFLESKPFKRGYVQTNILLKLLISPHPIATKELYEDLADVRSNHLTLYKEGLIGAKLKANKRKLWFIKPKGIEVLINYGLIDTSFVYEKE